MTEEKIKHFKVKLEEEMSVLETELKTVAEINPNNPGDWEPKSAGLNTDQADRLEVADEIEGFENNVAIVKNLETRFNEVKDALARIEAGTFGTCSIGGEEIEEDRLGANPSATTCKAHMGN